MRNDTIQSHGHNSILLRSRPLIASPHAIDALVTRHLFVGAQTLISLNTPIECLRTQPVVSPTPHMDVVHFNHLLPWTQPWSLWTPTFHFLVRNHAFPGDQPLSCGRPTGPSFRNPHPHWSSLVHPHHMPLAAARSTHFIQPSLAQHEHSFHCRLHSALTAGRFGPSRRPESAGRRGSCGQAGPAG